MTRKSSEQALRVCGVGI